MLGILISSLSTILGVVVGHLLASRSMRNEHKEVLKEREKERQEFRRLVLTLINLEVTHNLTALREFWRQNVDQLAVGIPVEQDFVKVYRFIHMPMPEWEHVRWQSLSTDLARALHDDELERMQNVHSWLDMLTDRRARIAVRMQPQIEQHYVELRRRGDAAHVSLTEVPDIEDEIREFLRDVYPLWGDCQDLYRKLDNSKPLKML